MRFAFRLLGACLTLALAAAAPSGAQEEGTGQETAKPCTSPEYSQFDFWVGDWEVRDPEGKVVGHNSIEKILNGCVLRESWRGAGGSVGHSFNIYDSHRGVWHQTWVDGNGLLLVIEGGLEDGSMVLKGDMPARDGGRASTRITWTPRDDGSVRQHWEASKDGETWKTVFDGIYVPAHDSP